MVGSYVESQGCGTLDSGSGDGTTEAPLESNATTEAPPDGGFSEKELCEIRAACAVTLMAGIIQVRQTFPAD